MNYHLQHQGQNLGIFPLDELRQRREAGELSGAELAWCEGMANWEPLDSVLQLSAQRKTAVTPPPLPPSALKKKPNRLLVCAVVAGVLLFAAGATWLALFAVKFGQRLRQASNQPSRVEDVALTSKPVSRSTNTTTWADVQIRAREFRGRQWLDGYQQRGQRNQACDAEAVQLIEAWIAKNYGEQSAANQPTAKQLGDKLAANPECNDPLILTVAALNGIEQHEDIRRLERALQGFEQSHHRAYPKFCATVTLASLLSDKRNRVADLDASAVRLLKEAFADGSFLPSDQALMGDILVTTWGNDFFGRNAASVYPIPGAAGKSFQWLSLVLDGEYQVKEAWKARGSGFVDTVTEQGWQGFSTHLAAARKSFTQAWNLRPELPLAATRMISVVMGDSDLEEMRLWFDRALAAQIDQPEAWSNMRWGVRPRWHGSLEAMLALGVTAVDTGRFDTDVPRKIFDVVTDMESELETPPGQHIYGREDIWPHMQRMYEGYVVEPRQKPVWDGWHGSYAVVAYLAGKYDVARTQLEALDWELRPAKLAGWGTDLSLLSLEVAARTGAAGKQIGQAETSRRRGNVTEALRQYTEQMAAANLDDRTRKFIRHRLASLEQERHLQEGGWVDFLPAEEHDPNWVGLRSQYQRLADGSMEIQAGSYGHLLFSRARVGPDFEVKGDIEVVRSSNKSFQAGLVMGLPDLNYNEWYAFRLKRNDVEGEIASFSRGWTKPHLHQTVSLNDERNSFQFRFQGGKASATLNGEEVLREGKPPRTVRVSNNEFLLGVGAFNDMNETVIRYRNLQVRRLSPRGTAANR